MLDAVGGFPTSAESDLKAWMREFRLKEGRNPGKEDIPPEIGASQ